MVPTSQHVSTSESRVNKKRVSGRCLLIWLSILFVSISVVIWQEELVEPLHRLDRGSRVSKSNFAWNDWEKYPTDDDLGNILSDSPYSSPKNKVSSRHMERNRETNNENRKVSKGTLRQKANAAEKFQTFPIIANTDDNIPLAVGGSIVHAADTLLCRDTVLDYVINATDLKDECDGLKKAYTQTCSADGGDDAQSEKSPRERQRRRLETQENAVIYWQRHLTRWSHNFRSWWFESSSSLMTTHRFLAEDRNPDAGEEPVTEFYDDVHRKAKAPEKANDKKSGNHRDDYEENETKLPSTVDTKQGKEFKNATKTINKKPLANLALPVTTKHVSDKMLTQTLMLEQDNKLMKAVANQTNHTVTEAQADASASSKAVSDAADMVSNVLNDPTSVEARTCCTSILNAFHETCSVNDEEELSDRRLFVGVAIIALCGLVKSLIRHYQIRWLPEAAGCILVGVTAGYILTFYPHNDISFDGNWFLRIMVPPIVFEAALSIDKRSFSRHIVPILFYAVLGTLVATSVTAFIVHEGSKLLHCETIPYAEALTFGALISSIDPIAVLSVLSNMGMTDKDTIYVVIFGESLLNDGVAIVLFETLVHFLDDDMIVDSHAVTAAAIHFAVVFIGSLLIGIGYGLCCTLYYWTMFGCQTPLVEVLMFLCWALLPYYVCDGIEWSGIVAVVAAGFLMDMYVAGTEKLVDLPEEETDSDYGDDSEKTKERRRRTMARHPIFSKQGLLSKEAKTHIKFVTEIIATMMETAIFAYLGLFLFSSRYHWNFPHVFVAVFGCSLSRAVMIPSLSTIANWITKNQQSRSICTCHEIHQQFNHVDTASKRSHQAAGVVIHPKMQLVLWFAGLRGAMSFALVEHIPQYDAVSGEGTRFKSELKAMTSACIVFTVFFLGGGTFYMMEALGMSPKSKSNYPADRETELIELLSSVETFDETDDLDDRNDTSGGESYTDTPTTNILRRPGRPVRRLRNFLSK